MDILVFKTDVTNEKAVRSLRPYLREVEGIIKWNVDLHDCDKVLRVESQNLSANAIECLLQDAGYYCKELDD
ncbi:hypothetical protein ACI6Q2_01480 [Chitinophagaceae bacterium LWZ2-11]